MVHLLCGIDAADTPLLQRDIYIYLDVYIYVNIYFYLSIISGHTADNICIYKCKHYNMMRSHRKTSRANVDEKARRYILFHCNILWQHPLHFSSVKAGDVHVVGRTFVPRRNAKRLRGRDRARDNLLCLCKNRAPSCFFNLDCSFQEINARKLKTQTWNKNIEAEHKPASANMGRPNDFYVPLRSNGQLGVAHIETTFRMIEKSLNNASLTLPTHNIILGKFTCKKVATLCESQRRLEWMFPSGLSEWPYHFPVLTVSFFLKSGHTACHLYIYIYNNSIYIYTYIYIYIYRSIYLHIYIYISKNMYM